MGKIKLVWEFFGNDAEQYAKHHNIHLEEFIQLRNEELISGFEVLNENLSIAYLIVPKDRMKEFKDLLKPHKGFLIE